MDPRSPIKAGDKFRRHDRVGAGTIKHIVIPVQTGIQNEYEIVLRLYIGKQEEHNALHWRYDWVKPKRDYRKYPVFTKEDIKKIEKWRNELI